MQGEIDSLLYVENVTQHLGVLATVVTLHVICNFHHKKKVSIDRNVEWTFFFHVVKAKGFLPTRLPVSESTGMAQATSTCFIVNHQLNILK